jgi:hypothetical protein
MINHLHDYFSQYTQTALQTVRHSLLAKQYYLAIERRLILGQDLSSELADIEKTGPEKTLEIVQVAIAEYEKKIAQVWKLPVALEESCKSKITMNYEYAESLPRFQITHQFKTIAGQLQLMIITKGENFTIEVITSKNKMAAEAAIQELEKLITFSVLLN